MSPASCGTRKQHEMGIRATAATKVANEWAKVRAVSTTAYKKGLLACKYKYLRLIGLSASTVRRVTQANSSYNFHALNRIQKVNDAVMAMIEIIIPCNRGHIPCSDPGRTAALAIRTSTISRS
ncbi:unnamed protein product [Aspergillus oryzae]|nr:unnamed protein product [Aspergillus oryzae]GMF83580.1 unnamed protein product [Aspergillus oryzae]